MFPITSGFLKLGVITAWCQLNPLLAGVLLSDSVLTRIWRTLWNLHYDMPMSLEHLKNVFKPSPKNVETISYFGRLWATGQCSSYRYWSQGLWNSHYTAHGTEKRGVTTTNFRNQGSALPKVSASRCKF